MNATQQSSKKLGPILIRRVTGRGMYPVLEPGRLVIALRKRKYHEEDVIILYHNGREKIKRIWMVRGERYDVRGDNPSRSTDSRQFGLIKHEAIAAKIIWPRV